MIDIRKSFIHFINSKGFRWRTNIETVLSTENKNIYLVKECRSEAISQRPFFDHKGRYEFLGIVDNNKTYIIRTSSTDGNKGNIQLFRIDRNGRLIRKKFRINLSKGISSKFNPPLKNGDVISINKSALAKVGTGLNVFAEPMRDLVTGLTLFKLFND